ncbi:DNA polymerase IV [Stratiformator vulcanicus]|uniref:DNA polymerase IV n=1 Tax=Stratiformator vulcanicus TaxID=2527980 RepID=A0A517R1J2_9PLAN|nr:DNA polymerase IV [Stratiformator vulcanicus]QDT37742.1 DNA polymerase IV [Stratiformator vulcanicus]
MILHVDMDAFYASVEERDRPELRGKPVVVGGRSGRGVVSAANYVARKFGIHSAMPGFKAKRLCPHAIFVKGRMSRYAEVSKQIREIFHRYTPLVQPLSLDEAFLDVTGSERLFGPAVDVGRRIQTDIGTELDLPCSVGVAPNKFLAKIASDLEKPNGFTVVQPGTELDFLAPLSVSRIWGVGPVAQKKLAALGIETVAQLRAVPMDIMKSRFGSHGEHLARLSRAIDDREVIPDHTAKSISHEHTFGDDIRDLEILRSWLRELTDQVGRRLRRHDRKARTVTLKIRYEDFATYSRSRTLPEPTNVTELFWRAADELLREHLPSRRLSVRLLGIGVSQIEASPLVQRSLFDEDTSRLQQLDGVCDEITERFGSGAVKHALSLGVGRREASENTDDLKQ